jgi:hypothetical protein
MKQITLYLKDSELTALLEIMKVRNIEHLHKVVKVAIQEYIRDFKGNGGVRDG